MNEVEKKLELLLDAMPKDLDGLVDYLRAENCKGRVGNVNSCPLANHFKERLGDSVSVSGSSISVGAISKSAPEHLKKFVKNFDDGKYPDLQR